MGWDAYSINPTPEALTDFKLASLRVKSMCGSVDGGLRTGWLDVSTCATMLQSATGINPYSEEILTPDLLNEALTHSSWRIPVSNIDKWALLSAKEFLFVCAKHRLSIKFSW